MSAIVETLRPYFESLSKEELIEAAVLLSRDAERLREELDKARQEIR